MYFFLSILILVISCDDAEFPTYDEDGPVIEYEFDTYKKTISLGDSYDGLKMEVTSDGNIALLVKKSNLSVVKVNTIGEILWNKSYSSTSSQSSNVDFKATDDGGFIILGGDRLVKTNSNGDVEWSKDLTIPKTSNSHYDVTGNSVIQTTDGGYLVAGYYNYYYNQNDCSYYYYCGTVYCKRGILYKMDSNGNRTWYESISGNCDDDSRTDDDTILSDVIENDLNYYAIGTLPSNLESSYIADIVNRILFYKVDFEGNALSSKLYTNYQSTGKSIAGRSNGFVLLAYSSSNNPQMAYVDMLGEGSFTSVNSDAYFNEVNYHGNNVLLAGYESNEGLINIFSETGQNILSKSFSSGTKINFNDIVQTNEKFTILGTEGDYSDKTIFLLKLDSSGNYVVF